MIPLLSRAEMRAFDAHAIRACSVPGVVLMENAGRGAADVIAQRLFDGNVHGARVVVVCGTGNNGGDGFVVARHLHVRGAAVDVFLAGSADKVQGDAKASLDALVGIGGIICEMQRDRAALDEAIRSADAVVDALFGTGLDRPVHGFLAEVIGAINRARAPRVALDVPSGLDADTGACLGAAVEADLTVTFAHQKLGIWTPGGARLAGTVILADIGVPARLHVRASASAQIIERSDVAAWIAPRSIAAHKYASGHVLVCAGSPGKTGAALMVGRGALRAGAGLATIATWPESATSIEARVAELMTAPIERAKIAASLDAVLRGKRAVVMGPGFGLDADARRAVEHVVATFASPIVLDADALTIFAGAPEALSAAKAMILTPHPGEAARLLGTTSEAVESDRFGSARTLAAKADAVIVLKGARTIVAAPDGRVAVNPTGNAALATAGAGDVLAGIVGAMACTLDPFEAACAAVYVHGLAADAWSDENGDRGLFASEIADLLPQVMAPLAREHSPWSV